MSRASGMMTCYDDAMRTIIDLPEEQLLALDAWRQVHGVSRAEAVRRAVAGLLEEAAQRPAAIQRTAGLWGDRAEDGLAMQRRLRDEWADR